MKNILFTLLLFVLPHLVFSQDTLILEWTMAVPEPATGIGNIFPKIITDSSGQPCSCANTHNPGAWTGYMTVKYTEDGTELWNNQMNGLWNEILKDCVADDSGNIIVGGHVSAGEEEIIIIKYDNEGNEVWTYSYPEAALGDLMIDEAQNIYLVGTTWYNIPGQDLLLVKITNDGDLVWEHRYEGTPERSYQGRKGRILDDRIIIAGVSGTGTPGQGNYVIHQVDLTGKTIETIENPNEDSFESYVTIDGKGNVFIGDAAGEYKVTKVDLTGDTMWHFKEPILGDDLPGGVLARLTELIIDENDHIYVSGQHFSKESSLDILVTKLDNSGEILWQNRYNHEGNYLSDVPYDLHVDKDFLYVGGGSQKNSEIREFVAIVYGKETGEEITKTRFNYDGNNFGQAESVSVFDNNVYITGRTDNGFQTPAFLITQKYRLEIETDTKETPENESISIYPNPIGALFYIDLQKPLSESVFFDLFSSNGVHLKEKELYKGQNQYIIQIEDLPEGMYFYKVSDKKGRELKSGKVIKCSK